MKNFICNFCIEINFNLTFELQNSNGNLEKIQFLLGVFPMNF